MITKVNACDIPDSRKRPYVMEAAEEIVGEFIASGYEACEVTVPDGIKQHSLVPSMSKVAKEKGGGLKVMTRKGRVFIVRGDAV